MVSFGLIEPNDTHLSMKPRSVVILATLLVAFTQGCAPAAGDAASSGPAGNALILATTTSTVDSGLLDVLIPEFEKKTGIEVKPIAVGTGQALALGERGEADVLLVHAPEREQEFVRAGHGIHRRLVMRNSFVIVGPSADPAGIRGKAPPSAFREISETGALFLSRGDDSGTHGREDQLWNAAGIEPSGGWYQQTGQGMGATLIVAGQKQAYTLTDRASFLRLRDVLDLAILVEGDVSLDNPYHVIEVNPEKSPRINASAAIAFAAFLLEPKTQELIGSYGVSRYGEPLFFPAQ